MLQQQCNNSFHDWRKNEMTVMAVSSDFADKAVSTEDGTSGLEVSRIEAVLAALVETKVEAMKASSSVSTKRSGSAPSSPRRPRLTSSSTVSSSQNHHHAQHRDDHHSRHDKGRRKKDRRHGSAPCGQLAHDHSTLRDHHKHGKTKRRASEFPRNAEKRCRYSSSGRALHDVHPGIDPRFELLGIDGEQDLSLINYDGRAREIFTDNSDLARLHQNVCYLSESAVHLKSHFDDEDYLALNIADEFEEEETLSGLEKVISQEKFHRPRKKRKKRRQKIVSEGTEVVLTDPDELPPRARWTIVATACLLLAMSLLLVGVTLRMAPIIDEMGDGRRASVCKRGKPRRGSTATRRKDSIRPTRQEIKLAQPIEPPKSPREIERARRHRRITFIILATFLFLLITSILAVVLTLTQSSFLSPQGSTELAQFRAKMRKENEELWNSLNRDTTVNTTTASSL